MNKILVVGLAAVLAATGNAIADDHKGSKGQNNEAPAAPVVQNAPRPSAGGAPRYSTQLPRFNGYANSPEMRRYPGSLALQSSGLPYRGPSRSGKQFDGRVLPDQSTNGAPRRNWRHFDLVQKGDPNDANHNLSGRRTRDGQNFLPGQDTVNRHRGNRVSPNDGTTVANIGRKRGGNPVVAFNNGNAVSLSDAWRRCHDFGRGHDRDWWHRRCHTIILIGDGFWAWDAGWWYPAWGFDSSYSNYAYDGPIYGYDGLAPDQVIANVQGALQELGYFPYAVDGVLGPTTEQALADYQRDQGLYATGAIDRPTLLSLGFIY
jgi:hypothetical protein